MEVEIAGKLLRLRQQQVIGVGGEGTVFRARVGKEMLAIKIYHTPTPERQEKLRALVSQNWRLPADKIALPRVLVSAVGKSDEIVGFAMPLLSGGPVEVAKLAQKKYRVAQNLTLSQIVEIFLDGAEVLETIHQNGLVVGDLNDQNLLFSGTQLYWIDVDAWQFADFACPVATEDFLVPELYGVDLSLRPGFQAVYDWYAFAVHLFRSLLLVHPYGGTHKDVALLTERAARKLYVMSNDVIYPKIASPVEVLSDELAELFERIFAYGWRGIFPRALLQHYRAELIACASCGLEYSAQRKRCPYCQTRAVMMPTTLSAMGVRVHELLKTPGRIVYYALSGSVLYALAAEDGVVVLYTRRPGLNATRCALFNEIPAAQYTLAGSMLVVDLPVAQIAQTSQEQDDTFTTRKELLCLSLEEEQPQPAGTLAGACFMNERTAMLQSTDDTLYSLCNGQLLATTCNGAELVSRPVRSVLEQHTWFRAAETGAKRLFGYFQVFARQLYWLQVGKESYDVALAELVTEERLLDLAVYFGNDDLLVRRLTLERGVEYLNTELVDYQGRIHHRSARVPRKDHPYPGLYGLVYNAGTLLHPTDEGIVQERIVQGVFKTFTATRGLVQDGTTLVSYQNGLLAINEQQIIHINL